MRYLFFFALVIGISACSQPVYTKAETIFENVTIQPGQAIAIAEKHLNKHGTVIWKDKDKLRTHIVKKNKYYYVKRADYPAKSALWYQKNCIRIDSRTGEVKYVD